MKEKETNNKKNITKLKVIIIILVIFLGLLSISFAYIEIKHFIATLTEQIQNDCEIETEEYSDKKVYVVTPKEGDKSDKKILFFHGGSYIAEMTEKHWEFIEKIVKDTGMTAIIPDYPLTPRYNYEDVFNMVEPLYKEIVEKVGGDNLIIMGDSAGGGISLGLLEKIGEDVEVPSKTILISPWLDVTMSNEKIQEKQQYDKDLSIDMLKLAGDIYAKQVQSKNYLVSPIYGDVSKLKNVTILTGTYDILNPDVYVLEEKVKNAGENVEVKTYDKAGHDWIIVENSSKELVTQGYNDLLETINH